MLKILIRYIAIAIVLIAFLILARKLNWLPSWSDIFKSKPVKIENTPILVKEINELSQLTTVTAFDEVVADSFRVSQNNFSKILPLPMPVLASSVDRIVLVGKGRVTAGIDLKKIKDSDIHVEKDSISIKLPQPEIFDAILNPSDFETFTEEGEWTPEAVTLVKIKARQEMTDRVIQQGILNRAASKGRQVMLNFLTGTGFK